MIIITCNEVLYFTSSNRTATAPWPAHPSPKVGLTSSPPRMYEMMTPTTMLSFTETVAAFFNGPVTVSRRYMGPHRRESPSPRP